MVSRRFLLAAVFAVLFTSSAAGRRLPVRVFTVADGLPQNEINRVLEDSRGFLWIGTSDGLARFDGRDFVTYGVAEGLPHPGVNDIFETVDGALWLATGAGVARFAVTGVSATPAAIRVYRLRGEGVGANRVIRLHQDRKGRIWSGTSTGLFVLDPGASSFRPVPLDLDKPPVPMVNASSFSETPEGDLWVGTTWGLVRILPDGRQVRYVPAEPDRPRGVRDVLRDAAGRIWICWDRDVFVYRPPPARVAEREVLVPAPAARCKDLPGFSPGPGEACAISRGDGIPDLVHTVHASRSGRIRLMSEKGVFAAEDGGLRRDETASVYGRASLECLTEDRHGSLWIGTRTEGLVRIARTGFSTYGLEDGLVSERVNSVFADSTGWICVTTIGGAFHRLDGERFVGVLPKLPPRTTYLGWGWSQIALQDREGEWWYATGEGLLRYPAVPLEVLDRTPPKNVYTKRDGLPGNNIFRLFEDSRGDIWVASIGAGEDGIARWERSSGRIRSEAFRPEMYAVSAFGEDREGNVWIGFYSGGLARRSRDQFEVFPPEGPAARGLITQIFRDSKGRLWIAARDRGVTRVDDPSAPRPVFRAYGRAQGLASDRTNAIAEDASGALYIATSRGIDRLDPSTGRIRHYTAEEGLASTATVSAFGDRLGRLWFGTLQGLFRFDPQPDTPAPPLAVYLRGVEIRGERFPVPAGGARRIQLPELSHDRNQLRIEFVAPSLAPAEQVRSRYRLEGRGGEWSEPSSERSVQYAGLPAGRYRFRVEAIGSGGNRSREPASLDFRILPPFWQRWWFLAAAGIALAGALGWFHRQRVAGLLAVERVRSRIAADLHDDLGTSLYRISILSELAGRQVAEPAKDVRPLLSDIGQTARDLIESAGDMVWSVDPRQDNLANLTARVRQYAAEMLEARGVAGTLESPENAGEIPIAAETRRELYLIFKEAIRNALRHGLPSHVAMRLAVDDGRIAAEIRDDGIGLPRDSPSDDGDDASGYGLNTMRRRAESLGGMFRVTSRPGEGTRILVEVPLRPRA